jgi:Mn-dependent DtxR family transcriptional regulator
MKEESGPQFHTVRGYELIRQQNVLKITPAMEDYLEMVYRLSLNAPFIRAGTLSKALNVRPSSVTKMIMKLNEQGLVTYDRYEVIFLTEAGRKTGAYLMRRHLTIESFLHLLGKKECLEEAELIEHSIGEETEKRMENLLEFFQQIPWVKAQWEEYLKNMAP